MWISRFWWEVNKPFHNRSPPSVDDLYNINATESVAVKNGGKEIVMAQLCSVNKKYIRPSQKSTKPSVFLTH